MINILIDNWTLQEVAHILNYGLSDRRTHSYSAPDFSPIEVLSSAIQIDSLFNVLLDIVLRDKLIVDHKWTGAWTGNSKVLDLVYQQGIIDSHEFILNDDFFQLRDYIIENLNLDQDIVSKHRENIDFFEKTGKNKHQALSTIVTGSVGYLTRSNLLSTIYSPHPIRSKFLISSSLLHSKTSSHYRTIKFIEDERLNIMKQSYGNGEFYTSRLILNPLILEIIESSNTINGLLNTAVQMRDEYKNFRKYLANFQQALNEGNFKKMKKYKSVLDDISQTNIKDRRFGTVEISLGFGFIKFSKIKIPSFVSLKNKFGIRSTINKLIFKDASEGTIDKFFGFFDEKSSALRREIKDYFIVN